MFSSLIYQIQQKKIECSNNRDSLRLRRIASALNNSPKSKDLTGDEAAISPVLGFPWELMTALGTAQRSSHQFSMPLLHIIFTPTVSHEDCFRFPLPFGRRSLRAHALRLYLHQRKP